MNETFNITRCYTTIARRTVLSDTQRTALACCFGLSMPSAVLLNLALGICLYKTRQIRSPSKFLFLCLCISDACIGLLGMPSVIIVFTVFGTEQNCLFEYMTMFFGPLNGRFSMYVTFAVALQRYLIVRPKFQTTFLVTMSGSRVLLVISLVLALSQGFVSTYFFGHVESRIPNIVLMIIGAIIGITIYILYFRLYFVMRRHSQQRKAISSSEMKAQRSMNRKHKKSTDVYRGFFKTMFFILISLALCYLPVIITDVWTGYYTLLKKTASPRWLRFSYYMLYFPYFINCSINALIFLFRDKETKAYFQRLFSLDQKPAQRVN